MPRQPTKLERYGEISYTAVKKDGKIVSYRARTVYRDIDGQMRPVERSGKSKSLAKDRLQEALDDRHHIGKDQLITGDTTLSTLADLWLAQCELDEGIAERSVNLYRQEINATTIIDARATATDTKIRKALGSVRVRELTTPRVDLHISTILAQGHRAKAKRHMMILRGMMALAVRHGARDDNPVREMKTIRANRAATTALETKQLAELRAQLRAWLKGEEIPGTPAFTSGAPRNPKVVQAADLLLGTGARPGEVLGLRRCDIDTTSSPWRATIAGTVVYAKGKGYYRQAHTKTGERGRHTVHLPAFCMETLRELGALQWEPGDETLVLPSRNGKPWNSNNFGRVWRQARGSNFAWVTPKTFRATVATLIADETDIATAAHQLSHAPGSRVTPLHYIARKQLAPDSTGILDRATGE